MSLHSSYLQEGRFLVNFFVAHTDNVCFDGINQQFWLQYHSKGGSVTPQSTKTHLVKPSATSEEYPRKKLLVKFHKWMNLTHPSTYIHGPFDFTTIRGRKHVLGLALMCETYCPPTNLRTAMTHQRAMCHHTQYMRTGACPSAITLHYNESRY